jgi:hypothetical protein
VGRSSTDGPVHHSCGLTDKQFLVNYQVQIAAVGVYANDYLRGDAKPQDVIGAATDAAAAVRSSAPFDPSLQTVKHFARPMFLEYARAVKARAAGKNAGPAMYRSYSFGAHVDEILREAAPGLAAAGCEVADLF